MGSMAIEYWGISLLDLSWVVKYDNLSQEVLCVLAGVILGVRSYISSLDILD